MATVQESIDMTTVSREVAEAYADCWDFYPDRSSWEQEWSKVADRRSLDFLATKWLPRDEAKWVMQQWVKSYNDFHPDLLDRLPRKALVRIARQGSVSLYVRGSSRLPGAAKMAADYKRPAILLGVECVHYWWD